MPRTRSPDAHRKVLQAAQKLFAEQGIDATSMDAVAARAGVSKATIYRHWTGKDELCLEVMVRLHGLDRERPAFDSGDPKADLVALLTYRPGPENSSQRQRMTPHLIAYAARNRDFGDAWRARVVEPPRRDIERILKRAVGLGLLRRDVDMKLAMVVLIGSMMYRHIFCSELFTPEELAPKVVEAYWAAHAA